MLSHLKRRFDLRERVSNKHFVDQSGRRPYSGPMCTREFNLIINEGPRPFFGPSCTGVPIWFRFICLYWWKGHGCPCPAIGFPQFQLDFCIPPKHQRPLFCDTAPMELIGHCCQNCCLIFASVQFCIWDKWTAILFGWCCKSHIWPL